MAEIIAYSRYVMIVAYSIQYFLANSAKKIKEKEVFPATYVFRMGTGNQS